MCVCVGGGGGGGGDWGGMEMERHLVSLWVSCEHFLEFGIPMGLFGFFYPRPVLAFGYCHRLRLCVCVSVCVCVCQSVRQSLACPSDNSGPVQARIAKFGPKV